MRLSVLYSKRVINLRDGETLGYVKDWMMGIPSGQMEGLIIAPLKHYYWGHTFDRKRELIIPWANVATIGGDVILVYYGK